MADVEVAMRRRGYRARLGLKLGGKHYRDKAKLEEGPIWTARRPRRVGDGELRPWRVELRGEGSYGARNFKLNCAKGRWERGEAH